MGRSKLTPVQQPDEYTCGPTAMKLAFEVFGKKVSLKRLIKLCKTNNNGTTTKHIIDVFTKFGFPVLSIERANLRHIHSILKPNPQKTCAGLVTYLYDLNDNKKPHPESGHWALIFSYSSRSGRIILLDSSTGKKKSYSWKEFRKRWKDYDVQRKIRSDGSIEYKKHWQHQLLLVVAKKESHLPRFTIRTQKTYSTN